MKKFAIALIVLFFIVLLTAMIGCSAFRTSTQTLSIRCSEPDAYVSVNGDKIIPPAKVDVRRNSKVMIEAKKSGFIPYSKQISYHINETGILDAVGIAFTFFSVFGLLTPGAWSLNETDINIELSPEEREVKLKAEREKAVISAAPVGKDLPKIAVWDLVPREVKPNYAQELTSILVSEISKLEKYEVYSQDNVRTLAGWTADRMTLGSTDTKCLTALGQMEIAKLISGSVGKIGNTYSISLNLFDTQSVRAENSVSDECRSEDELIPLVRQAVTKLLGENLLPPPPSRLASEGEVRQFFEIYVNLYNRKEIATFIYLFSLKAIQNQKDDLEKIRKTYESFFDQMETVQYRVTINEIKPQQNSVEVRGQYALEGVLMDGRKKKNWKGQVRWVLVREGGALKVLSLDYQPQSSK